MKDTITIYDDEAVKLTQGWWSGQGERGRRRTGRKSCGCGGR